MKGVLNGFVTVVKDDAVKISNAIDTKTCLNIGIQVPALNTAIMYVLGSNDNLTFYRLQKEDGSGDWTLASGEGGKAVWIRFPFRFLEIGLSATQTTADRVFKIFAKD